MPPPSGPVVPVPGVVVDDYYDDDYGAFNEMRIGRGNCFSTTLPIINPTLTDL
jgi:hypothetical protein